MQERDGSKPNGQKRVQFLFLGRGPGLHSQPSPGALPNSQTTPHNGGFRFSTGGSGSHLHGGTKTESGGQARGQTTRLSTSLLAENNSRSLRLGAAKTELPKLAAARKSIENETMLVVMMLVQDFRREERIEGMWCAVKKD